MPSLRSASHRIALSSYLLLYFVIKCLFNVSVMSNGAFFACQKYYWKNYTNDLLGWVGGEWVEGFTGRVSLIAGNRWVWWRFRGWESTILLGTEDFWWKSPGRADCSTSSKPPPPNHTINLLRKWSSNHHDKSFNPFHRSPHKYLWPITIGEQRVITVHLIIA